MVRILRLLCDISESRNLFLEDDLRYFQVENTDPGIM